jgi:hypothetical protein
MTESLLKIAPVIAAFILISAVCSGSAHAQTVVNPRTVEFDPSADHSMLGADSQPIVQRYDLQIYAAGAAQPTTTVSLGKPAPQADGKIRVDFSTLAGGWPLADGTYEARVAAVGTMGIASSDPSNAFAFQSCSVALGSASQAVPAGGATGSVSVSAAIGCAWRVTTDASWVIVAAEAGSGAGAVNFTVTGNVTASVRAATLTIGGQAFTITQAALAPCSSSLSAASQAFGQGAGSGSVSLTSGNACAWSASSTATWVTILNAAGTGPATVSYTVAKNSDPTPRTATVTIAGLAYRIDQAAASRPSSPKKVRVLTTVVGG